MEIAEKILAEEERMKQRRVQQPHLFVTAADMKHKVTYTNISMRCSFVCLLSTKSHSATSELFLYVMYNINEKCVL